MAAPHRIPTENEHRNQIAMLVYSGANGVAMSLLSSSLVMAVLIRALGGSNFLVGIMANYRLFSRITGPWRCPAT